MKQAQLIMRKRYSHFSIDFNTVKLDKLENQAEKWVNTLFWQIYDEKKTPIPIHDCKIEMLIKIGKEILTQITSAL